MHDSELVSVPAPICSICNKPVSLNSAKTDEDGTAIHEACYLVKLGVVPLGGHLKVSSVDVLKAPNRKQS